MRWAASPPCREAKSSFAGRSGDALSCTPTASMSKCSTVPGGGGGQINHKACRAVHALKPHARRAFGFGPLQRFAHDFRQRHAHAGFGRGDGVSRHGRKAEACQFFGQVSGSPEFGHAGFRVMMKQSVQGRNSFLREWKMMFCRGGCACRKKGKERIPSPGGDGRAREIAPSLK